MKILQHINIKDFPYYLIIIPVCLVAAALVYTLPSAASGPVKFKLGWNANEEADLDGYEIYYRKEASDSTYEFLAEIYVDEFEDPDNPLVSITDLHDDLINDLITPVVRMAVLTNNSHYYFALKAFNTQGKTSDFSEELCVEVIGATAVECGSAESGRDTGDGGDGVGDNESPAENTANSGSGGAESAGPATKSAGGGSGGGCFITASSFEFRETAGFLFN